MVVTNALKVWFVDAGAPRTGALFLLLPLVPGQFVLIVGTEILILGLFALSFNLIHGYMGQISFGHAAFFGLGAYTTALIMQPLVDTGAARRYASFFCRTGRRSAGSGLGGARRRLLLRSPDGHLFRHALARVRRIALLHRVLLVRLHQGRRRHPGPAAAAAVEDREIALLLLDVGDRRLRRGWRCGGSRARRSATCCACCATTRTEPPFSASTCDASCW